MTTEYKTRSEVSGDSTFSSFEKVIEATVKDHTIWKVLYTSESGNEVIFTRDKTGGQFKKEE